MPYCYWHTRFNGGVYVTSKSMINIHVMLIKSLTYSRQGPARHSTCTLTLHLKTSSHLFTPGDIFYNCGHPLFDNYKIRCYITRKKKTIKCLFALQFKKNLPLNIFIWYNKKNFDQKEDFWINFLLSNTTYGSISISIIFTIIIRGSNSSSFSYSSSSTNTLPFLSSILKWTLVRVAAPAKAQIQRPHRELAIETESHGQKTAIYMVIKEGGEAMGFLKVQEGHRGEGGDVSGLVGEVGGWVWWVSKWTDE